MGTTKSEKNTSDHSESFRSAVAQFLAAIASNLTIMTFGLMIVLPTLAIGRLQNNNSGEDMVLNEDESSWFGSLQYLLQPCSCVIGALLQPHVGRKYGLILALVPQIIAWICLSIAKSVNLLYLSVVLFGISTGFVEPPLLSYLGEISEPRLRSLLTCMSTLSFFSGTLLEFFIGSIFDWRQTAAVSIAFPVIGILLISFIPDSPLWLLKKGKEEAAMKSLCWLRGWVKEDSVRPEFEEMKCYIQRSRTLFSEETNDGNSKTTRFRSGWKKITRPNMWKPLLLLAVCHTCYHSTSLTGMRSYFVEILRTLQVTIEPSWFLFINSILTLCGGLVCFSTVKFLGKRKLILSSLLMTSLSCVLLGAYIIFSDRINNPRIPQILILTLNLFVTAGINPIPWMLSSEIFSISNRSLGAGLGSSLFYILGFLFSKTFFNLKDLIQLSGCFILYGILGIIGLLYLYPCLPETEGKTLAEIEEYFSKVPETPIKEAT